MAGASRSSPTVSVTPIQRRSDVCVTTTSTVSNTTIRPLTPATSSASDGTFAKSVLVDVIKKVPPPPAPAPPQLLNTNQSKPQFTVTTVTAASAANTVTSTARTTSNPPVVTALASTSRLSAAAAAAGHHKLLAQQQNLPQPAASVDVTSEANNPFLAAARSIIDNVDRPRVSVSSSLAPPSAPTTNSQPVNFTFLSSISSASKAPQPPQQHASVRIINSQQIIQQQQSLKQQQQQMSKQSVAAPPPPTPAPVSPSQSRSAAGSHLSETISTAPQQPPHSSATENQQHPHQHQHQAASTSSRKPCNCTKSMCLKL